MDESGEVPWGKGIGSKSQDPDARHGYGGKMLRTGWLQGKSHVFDASITHEQDIIRSTIRRDAQIKTIDPSR
jgi:hypothetical protein